MNTPFSVNSLAEYWGCSPNLVRGMIKAGELPHFRLGGKMLRIRYEDVKEWELTQSESTASEGSMGDGAQSGMKAKATIDDDAGIASLQRARSMRRASLKTS